MGFTLGKQDWFNSQESVKVILHINRLMRKTHIVLTINAKKASEKISFMQNSDKRNQKDLNQLPGILCSWSNYSQLDLQIQHIPTKTTARYFIDNDKMNLKFIWEGKDLDKPIQY